MKNQATLSCTALAGTNKVGALKPDSNGYYEMVLGAYDFFNSSKAIYPFTSAKHLFEESSMLMRRINNGQCRSEYGHPKKQRGMTMSDYIQRIVSIEETNICAHIKSIRIDTQSVMDDKGKPVTAVIGMVKPSGPRGPALRESLDNPDENVAFSVRSLTNDTFENGGHQKHMKQLITWDYVNEPGISIATKYNAPSLEELSEDLEIVPMMLDRWEAQEQGAHVGMESILTSKMVRSDFGWQKVQSILVPSSTW